MTDDRYRIRVSPRKNFDGSRDMTVERERNIEVPKGWKYKPKLDPATRREEAAYIWTNVVLFIVTELSLLYLVLNEGTETVERILMIVFGQVLVAIVWAVLWWPVNFLLRGVMRVAGAYERNE